MNKSRNLYYYFGRNEKHDYIATPMDSCIIAGRTGAGKSTFIDSLLVRLIQETNPKDITIQYHDCKGFESKLWTDSIPDGKCIPQLYRVTQYDNSVTGDKNFKHLTVSLSSLYQEVQRRLDVCREQDAEQYLNLDTMSNSILFIIDEYQYYVEEECKNDGWFEHVVRYIVENSKKTGVYIMLCSQGTRPISDGLVKEFPIRIVTPCDEKLSNLFIGNNAAYMDEARYGVVWVKNGKDYPTRLYVPFYPDTWIRKFVGYYSIWKQE